MNYKTRMLALLALFLLTISVSRASQTEEKDYVATRKSSVRPEVYATRISCGAKTERLSTWS